MRLPSKSTILGAVILATACGKAPAGDAPRPSNDRVLTEEEILASNASNLYDAIRVLRPNWLRRSGARATSFTADAAEISVYLDGQRYGELALLAGLAATSVRSVEYLSASEAQARFGQNNLGGVIHVHSHGTGR